LRRRAFLAVAAAASVARLLHAASPDTLVLAAASLTDALDSIGAAYARGGGRRVAFAFGASGDLARQVRAGAPAAVFVSADSLQVDALVRDGRVRPAERIELLSNRLVVVVPAGSSRVIRSAEDLLAVPRLAVADPESVPLGRYAREWLQQAGLWARLQPQIVPALDARAALAGVETQALEAGIVYATDAGVSKRVRVAFKVPAGQAPRIVYTAALLTSEGRPFFEFLRSPEARVVFERLGFEFLPGRSRPVAAVAPRP
jgi:molybdate transport system substrate-binding protein